MPRSKKPPVIDLSLPTVLDRPQAKDIFAQHMLGEFDRILGKTEMQTKPLDTTIASWEEWIRLICQFKYKPSQWQQEAWSWVWSLTRDRTADPFVAIAPRGAGKSSTAESIAVALGGRNVCNYVLYVRATQAQANASVSNIAGILESPQGAMYFPQLSQRMVGKFGQAKGWNRTMVRTASSFNVVAFGLDSALRGTKLDDYRPDAFILDDLDELHDTNRTTEKKIETLTKSILPAGATFTKIFCVQNLMIPNGIFARLAQKRASFLTSRKLSGPWPAINGLEYEITDEGAVITAGTATWEGQSIAICQQQMRDWGISSFLTEAQHDVEESEGGIFSHLDYEYTDIDNIDFDFVACWLDPAVSSGERSHRQGVQIDGVGTDPTGRRRIYRLYSWSGVESPDKVITRALREATHYHAKKVGIETNQGGDLWETTYETIAQEMFDNGDIEYIPKFASEKATAAVGSKVERAQKMLADYERGRIVHTYGTHAVLELALKQFPKTVASLDLVDAAYWSWSDCAEVMRKARQSHFGRLKRRALFGGHRGAGKENSVGRRLGLRM